MDYCGPPYSRLGRYPLNVASARRFRRKGDSEEEYLRSQLQQVTGKHQEYIREHFNHTRSNTQSLDREQYRFLKAFKKADQSSWRGLLEKGFTADPHTLKEVLKITDDAVSGTVKQYLNELCTRIKEGGSSIKHVWAACKAGSPHDVVFVVERKNNVDPEGIRFELNKRFPSLRFEIRVSDEVNSEARKVMYSQECKLKPLTEDDHHRLKQCIARHSARLLKEHSNIQLISPCSVRSERFGTKYEHIRYETCIVLYVKYKGIIPFGESLFPKHLDRIPVDVREGEFKFLSNIHLENLRMGCQIGALDVKKCGTLGGFVDLPDGSIGVLTCAHVLLKNEEFPNHSGSNGGLRYTGAGPRLVSQPVLSNRDCEFGTLDRTVWDPGDEYTAGVDAALVKITATDRSPTCGNFDCAEVNHRSRNNRVMFCSGNIIKNLSPNIGANEIFKCGSRTGMTKGRLHYLHTVVSPQDDDGCPIFQTMSNQIEIKNVSNEKFSDKGDSGALIMVDNEANRNDLNAIGMLIGSTSYDTTIASPIGEVLRKLNIGCEKLKTFPMEEEDWSTAFRSRYTSRDCLSVTTNLPSVAIQGDLVEIQRDIRQMKEDIARIHEFLLGGSRYTRRI